MGAVAYVERWHQPSCPVLIESVMPVFSVLLRRWSPRLALAGLAMLLVLSGCRTYGQYDNTALMLQELKTANERFAEQLQQARADIDLLRDAAAENEALSPYVAEFEAAVSTHERMLEEHQALQADAEMKANDYRVVHRNFGAIVTDHSGMRDQYVRIIRAVDFEVNPERAAERHLEPREKSQYQSTPPQYDQIRYREANRLQMEDVLRG